MKFDETKKKHADTVPSKNITVDLNTTRIAAVRILINDCLRMKKGLQYYAMDFDISESYWPSVTDWQQVRDVEGILDLVCHLTTVAQYEKYFMAAYGPAFKMNLYEKLRALTIDLIDLSLWNKKDLHAPRIAVDVNTLSDIIKEVRRRAILEFERRFMDNKKEVTFQQQGIADKEMYIHDCQLMALLLDPRTKLRS